MRIVCRCVYRILNLKYRIHYLLSPGRDSARIERLNGLYLKIWELLLSCDGMNLLLLVLGELRRIGGIVGRLRGR